MKRPIALLASLLAVTVFATAATAAGGDSSDPLISLNYLQTTFTTKATSSIDAALDKADQAAYAKAEAALRSTIAAAEANVGAQRADVFTESRLKQGDILSGTTGLQVLTISASAAPMPNSVEPLPSMISLPIWRVRSKIRSSSSLP